MVEESYYGSCARLERATGLGSNEYGFCDFLSQDGTYWQSSPLLSQAEIASVARPPSLLSPVVASSMDDHEVRSLLMNHLLFPLSTC